jgi:hypothetical protein
VLHDYADGAVGTRFVSARDVAHALAGQLSLTSGLLPPDALWWARTAGGERVALWREPRVWMVRLRTAYDAPVRRLKLPMPGLVFVCLPARQPPYVFAARARPRSPDDQLFHAPAFNVFASGAVCPGSHVFPANPSKVPDEFFASHFSVTADTARGKSKRHPDDVGALWNELAGATAYPFEDLVPQLRVADAMRIGE